MIAFDHLTVSGRLGPVSGELKAGCWLGVCGPNGAGKTTLLLALSGVLSSSKWQGGIQWSGVPLRTLTLDQLARQRAVCLQTAQADMFPVVVEQLLTMSTACLDCADQRLAYEYVVSCLELEPLLGRSLDQLSGGQRQRCHLARCLIQVGLGAGRNDSKILFLDEPFTGLDRNYIQSVLGVLSEFNRMGGTIMMHTHQLHYVQQYCDEAWLLKEGRMHQQGGVHSVFTQTVIESLFGSSTAPIVDSEGRRWWV